MMTPIRMLTFRSLNPCSNGIQKYNYKLTRFHKSWFVLILVLMEYKNTLERSFNEVEVDVLILVLMEYKNTL